jgi:hypothetical protein
MRFETSAKGTGTSATGTLHHRRPHADSTNEANRSKEPSPVHRATTSQHQQPAGGWQSHIDLSPELTISSPANPDVDAKAEERKVAGKQSWRDRCVGDGLEAGDEKIMLSLKEPLLEEDGNFNQRAIFPQKGIMRHTLSEHAWLMQARNLALEAAYGAAQELQALQGEYQGAVASHATEDTLSDLRGKVQDLTELVRRANDEVSDTQKTLKRAQDLVVEMLNGSPARRLFGARGALAGPVELAAPGEMVGPVVHAPPDVIGAPELVGPGGQLVGAPGQVEHPEREFIRALRLQPLAHYPMTAAVFAAGLSFAVLLIVIAAAAEDPSRPHFDEVVVNVCKDVCLTTAATFALETFLLAMRELHRAVQ